MENITHPDKMNLVDPNNIEIKHKTMKGMLWLGIFSMIMVFGSLTSAYIVRKYQGNWGEFTLPSMFYVSTAVILLSSVTMNMGLVRARKGDNSGVKKFVLLTLVLGLLFTLFQFIGYRQLVDTGIFFVDPKASGSYLYLLTGLHLAHLFGGLIALLVVAFRAGRNKYSEKNHLGVRLCSIYWHFLDGLWIYLFLFLLIIN